MASKPDASNLHFNYPPLNEEERQIRLVTVDHIDAAGVLHCSLSTISLNEPPEYVALSYTWGPHPASDNIVVNESHFKVRHNLYDFFIAVAAKKLVGVLLFVDAICIDQSCLEEKNSQVPLMRDVYSCASIVIAWLGSNVNMFGIPIDMNNAAISQAASRFLLPALTYVQNRLQTTDPTFQPEQKLLEELDRVTAAALFYALFSPFWTRMWIVQEITLAKSLFLQIAGHTIGHERLEVLVVAFKTFSSDDPDSTQPFLEYFRSNVRVMNLFLNVQAATKILKQRCKSESVPLYQALIAWSTQSRTEPRDAVFGLLGISTSRIAVDYNISITQLFMNVLIEGLLEINDTTKREQRIAVQYNFYEACMAAFSYSRTDTTVLHIMRSATLRFGTFQELSFDPLWVEPYAVRDITMESWSAPVHLLMSGYITLASLLLGITGLERAAYRYNGVQARIVYIMLKYKLDKIRSSDSVMVMPDGEACRYSDWTARIVQTADFLRGSGPSPQNSDIPNRTKHIRKHRRQMRLQKCVEIAIELCLAIVVVTIAVLLGALVKTTCASLASFITNLFAQQYSNYSASDGRAQEHIEL